MTDPLPEIKARLADDDNFYRRETATDIAWLVGEIERLRERLAEEDAAEAVAERRLGLLGRLEWAGGLVTFPDGCEPCCPACEVEQADPHGHEPDCWLAAELAHNANEASPPKG
jgi:hypothetical protein